MQQQISWRALRRANPPLILLCFWLVLLAAVGAQALDAKAMPLAQQNDPAHSVTRITYQGRLQEDGAPVNGSYDFEFRLFDALEGGIQIGSVVTVQELPLSDGFFTAELDFGPGAFDGTARYLEIGIRPANESGDFMRLQPRQRLTAVPLALALPGFHTEAISTTYNTWGGVISNSIAAQVVGAWVTGGEVDAPNRVNDHYGLILGGAGNVVGADEGDPFRSMRALIVGGISQSNEGPLSAIVAGRGNSVSSGLSFVGGGRTNRISGPGLAVIGGGLDNIAASQGAAILGGRENKVTDEYSTIGGGVGNLAGNQDDNPFNVTGATVGGGNFNAARGSLAVVSGGSNNAANGIASVIGGGLFNLANGAHSAIGGGKENEATGEFATIPGGTLNLAQGAHSFAAGKNARALHDGSFIWSDGSGQMSSTAPNQFNVLSTGGVKFDTGGAGVTLFPGSGSWTGMSDRNAKENFMPVEPLDVLESVAALPLTTWNYKSQSRDIRHMGPMAQDFFAAFGLGEDERYISAVDADGVALAAIQGLYQLVRQQQAEIAALQQENRQLLERIDIIESRLAALEGGTR